MTDRSPSDEHDRLVAELREQIAARDEFIAIAAHELRNPMTPIVAQVQLLIARAKRDNVTTILPGLFALETAVDHYMRRATVLLEISRINAGHLQLALEEFDLCEVVNDCTRKYQQLANHAGSVLRCRVPTMLTGRWDRLAIEQILDNLISNAIRYGDSKPVDVEVDLDAGADVVVLRVVDRGIGIHPDDRERIFDRFERAAGNKRDGGFGIGLWLTHQLVRAQGGELGLESELGAGSTFTIRLPRHQV